MAGDRYSYRGRRSKSGLAYFLLAVVFVLGMLKWGLPLFINLVAGTESKNGLSANNEDKMPPQTPILSALPEATNSAQIKVNGFTEPKVEVSIWRNEELVTSDNSDDQGAFKIELRLIEGENRLQVRARDDSGNESLSAIWKIIYDKSEITISIDSPNDGSEFFGKSNQNLMVNGKVNQPSAVVTVNGAYTRVDSDGKFGGQVRLKEGENDILVRVVGKSGNSAQKTIKVKFSF